MFSSSDAGMNFDKPKRRPLRIYASDPMTGRNVGNWATVEVENEDLLPGPVGERIVVVDYNSSTGNYYQPVDLNDPNLLMQGGITPTESDPRFHQQMVYAVAMRTLENFDRALGRRIYLQQGGKPLRLFPHAFYGANAYFDNNLNAVLFGYFKADEENPGENLPGQTVFTCLSHDIIAHEVTHAIVNRLRRNYLEPSNIDVLAFHEGFSDLVALFQHFSFADVVRNQIQKTGPDLRKAEELLGLAVQFGHATAAGKALRSAIRSPEVRLSPSIDEPHERGAILVAAVFDAFIAVYERRTADLLLLSGLERDTTRTLHPLLVQRLATEASRLAQSLLTMCIRAFDYMPPVDVTFGDFLRAIVTADYELSPSDELGLRAALIEGFRTRGIYPTGVTSAAEESLLWPPADPSLPRMNWNADDLLGLIVDTAARVSGGVKPKRQSLSESEIASEAAPTEEMPLTTEQTPAQAPSEPTTAAPTLPYSVLMGQLHDYAKSNVAALLLDPTRPIHPVGLHPGFRVSTTGRLVIELIAQVDQKRVDEVDRGGVPLKGGTTLIVSFDGTVKYCVAKPLPGEHLDSRNRALASQREEAQAAFLASGDMKDNMVPYLEEIGYAQRAKLRADMATLHFSR